MNKEKGRKYTDNVYVACMAIGKYRGLSSLHTSKRSLPQKPIGNHVRGALVDNNIMHSALGSLAWILIKIYSFRIE
jgi:hypothetical protein